MGAMEPHVSNARLARTAGLFYLIVVASGIFSLGIVPAQTLVPGDGAATVAKLIATDTWYRLGIAAGFVCYTAFPVLPLVLYRLLSPVNRRAAALMVAFAVVSVPMSLINLGHKLDVLSLLGGAGNGIVFSSEQRQAQVMLALAAYGNGLLIVKIFWGLWLLPFGYLVFKSAFLPKVLGVLLMLGCFGYLVDVGGRLLVPGYLDTAIATVATMPASLGEIGSCLWLLIMGARPSPVVDPNNAKPEVG